MGSEKRDNKISW